MGKRILVKQFACGCQLWEEIDCCPDWRPCSEHEEVEPNDEVEEPEE